MPYIHILQYQQEKNMLYDVYLVSISNKYLHITKQTYIYLIRPLFPYRRRVFHKD